jgi:hypothetical protein
MAVVAPSLGSGAHRNNYFRQESENTFESFRLRATCHLWYN